LIGNIELWLAHKYIHADLSAYNVLYWRGKACFIDFPQSSTRASIPTARPAHRDIENICRYAARYGLEATGTRIAQQLWPKFKNAEYE